MADDPQDEGDAPAASSWPRTIESAYEWQAGTAPGAQAGLINALSRSAQPSLHAVAAIGWSRLRRLSGAGGADGDDADAGGGEEEADDGRLRRGSGGGGGGFGSGIEEEEGDDVERQEDDDDDDVFFPGGVGFDDEDNGSASLARPLLFVPGDGRRRSLLLERGHRPSDVARQQQQQNQEQQDDQQQQQQANDDDAAMFPALREASLPAAAAAGPAVRLVLEEADRSGTSSTFAAGLNAVNVLCGVGLLAMPFASAQAGWVSFLLLAAVAGVALFSGSLLEACMSLGSGPPPPGSDNSNNNNNGGGNALCAANRRHHRRPPPLRSFPDLGGAAFGRAGRVLVALLLYLELMSCVADFLILEGDNLAALLPLPSFLPSSSSLTPQQSWALAAAVMVLPTVLLRDLSALSYLSAGGIGGSVAIVGCIVSSAMRAAAGGDGGGGSGGHGGGSGPSSSTRPLLPSLPLARTAGLPVALGLYSFSFSGAACFPSIYVSMRDRRQFRGLLAGAFSAVALLYAAAALAGLSAFGAGVKDQVTLSMGSGSLEGRIAAWLVVVSPLTKIALTLAPVALAVEEAVLSPPRRRGQPRQRGRASLNAAKSAAVRVALLAVCAAAAVLVPFFALLSQIIGAFMCLHIAVILPALFFLRLRWRHAPRWQLCVAACAACVAEVGSLGATFHALKALRDKY